MLSYVELYDKLTRCIELNVDINYKTSSSKHNDKSL